jgi:DNA-binding transcriptional MerR regulator
MAEETAGTRLTIGELASRTGVATSALRYWEQLGLLPAPDRVSGQRRYPSSAVVLVGEIVLLRDVGFTLREITELRTLRTSAAAGWRELHERKLAELDERIAHMRAARTAIAHGLACPHDDIHDCPTFARGIAALLAGATLEQAHGH